MIVPHHKQRTAWCSIHAGAAYMLEQPPPSVSALHSITVKLVSTQCGTTGVRKWAISRYAELPTKHAKTTACCTRVVDVSGVRGAYTPWGLAEGQLRRLHHLVVSLCQVGTWVRQALL